MITTNSFLDLLDGQSMLLAILVVGLSVLVIDYVRILVLRRKMPPGPIPYPIIGNTFQLPDKKPWILFESLSKTYNSPLVTFWIGRTPTIWINSATAASDLLDHRAATFSSRPEMIVFGKLGFDQSSLVTMRYGDRFRTHRKLSHMGFGIQKVKQKGEGSMREIQSDENKVVLLDFLREPEEFVGHLERYAASVSSILGFGRRISSYQDPIVSEVVRVMQHAAELNVPGKEFPMLMETFPALAKFPSWVPWKRSIMRMKNRNFFYALAEEATSNKTQHNSYAQLLFSEREKYNLTDMEVSSLAGNLFGAGSDTSSSTLITFVLACCAFPEALSNAWAELDRVVGHTRSPSIDDEDNLSYVKAFTKEVLRWRPVAVLGGQPHAPTTDEVYNGYHIPKDTWIQGNLWGIHRNEENFPNPDIFNPHRYFENHPDYRPFPNDKGYMSFGWGRRVCAGQALAEQGTFISIARLLWAFRIRKAVDQDGKEIPVDIFAYTDGLNMRPQPFKCTIIPRSDKIREVIEREGAEALENLSRYNGETKYRMSTYYQS